MSRRTLAATTWPAAGALIRAADRSSRWRRAAVCLSLVSVAGLLVLLLPTSVLAQSGQIVEYYHLDALGSVRVVTDQAGQVIARHDFLPFGEEWSPPANAKEKKLFTGHERDAETGLDYFGARYYRPQVGRFTTIDPVYTWSENLTDPQRWNRYAYVTNNPLKYTDPDGKTPLLITGGIGAAVYGGWAIYQNVSHGKPWYKNLGVEAAKGFVVGATLGVAAPALAAADVGVGTATLAIDAAAASRVASTALRFDPSTIFNDARKVEHMFKEVHQLEVLVQCPVYN